jgi:hypothetical protein
MIGTLVTLAMLEEPYPDVDELLWLRRPRLMSQMAITEPAMVPNHHWPGIASQRTHGHQTSATRNTTTIRIMPILSGGLGFYWRPFPAWQQPSTVFEPLHFIFMDAPFVGVFVLLGSYSPEPSPFPACKGFSVKDFR